MIYQNALDLIGNTPVVRLSRFQGTEPGGDLYIKLEKNNPGGSIKDRPGLYILEKAEQTGRLAPGGTVIEATSGNMGIGLAVAATVKGYRLCLVMPENMSIERQKLLRFYGAELVLTPAAEGMAGAVAKAQSLASETAGSYLVSQFDNRDNAACHAQTTAREILEQLAADGGLAAVVAGIGSGGTITGLGEAFRSLAPSVKIIGVEPAASAVINGEQPGNHKIQGIGAGFFPGILNLNVIDEVVPVRDEDALACARRLARAEALLIGISAGAALWAATHIRSRFLPGERILVIAPDGADKYISTELFD